MMTLIIFLIIFIILLLLFVLWKIKAKLLIKLTTSMINAKVTVFNHDFNFSHDLETRNKAKNNKIQLKEVKDIISLADISETEILLTVGTPLVNLTSAMVVLLSTLIPMLHERYFDGNGSIKYTVVPNYKEFILEGTIKINFFITPLELFLIWKRF